MVGTAGAVAGAAHPFSIRILVAGFRMVLSARYAAVTSSFVL
jgi:hypothetical protein